MPEQQDCNLIDVGCKVENAFIGAIERVAEAVTEAVGNTVASLGTMWVNIGSPTLDRGAVTDVEGTPPGTAGITLALSYMMWISLAIAIFSLIALGTMLTIRIRSGDGMVAVGKIGLVLGAVVLISGASTLVAALLDTESEVGNAGGTATFIQDALWWYMGAAVVLSVIVASARMAWEQRADAGRDLLRSLLTLIVVAGTGLAIVTMLVTAADEFSVWILDAALECDLADNGACFGATMTGLLALGALTGLGAMIIIGFGLIAMLATGMQIMLMIARGGMLVILAGILPLAASATNTEAGKAWFHKCVSWLVAFILYKPAAAIIYATAIHLTGTNIFQDDGTGLISVLTGLMLMILALAALPALMRFVTPMVGAVAGSGGGSSAAIGTAQTVATGAISTGRSFNRSPSTTPTPHGARVGSSPNGPAFSSGSPSRAGTSHGISDHHHTRHTSTATSTSSTTPSKTDRPAAHGPATGAGGSSAGGAAPASPPSAATSGGASSTGASASGAAGAPAAAAAAGFRIASEISHRGGQLGKAAAADPSGSRGNTTSGENDPDGSRH